MIPSDLKHLQPSDFKAPLAAVSTRLCRDLDALSGTLGTSPEIHCTYDVDGHAVASRHKLSPCDAVDLHFMGVPPAVALHAMLAGPWGGVGWYPHWNNPGFHLDQRPGPRKFWVRSADGYVYGLPVLLQAVGLTLADVEGAGPCPSDAFRAAHAFTAKAEEGKTVDKGGATNYGVSIRFLRGLGVELGDIDHDGDIDVDDIQALTPADAQRLMRLVFWDGLRLDNLPRITAATVYDYAVNAGPVAAVKSLQMACNFYPGVALFLDGVLGRKTRSAVADIAANDQRDLILAQRVTSSRRAFYRGLYAADAAHPLAGWLNRCDALDRYCTKLAANPPAQAVAA